MLNPHMARLAKAHQIGQRICLGRTFEKSKRADVVNGYRVSYAGSTFLADTFVAIDGGSSSFNPSFPAIGSNPSNKIWGVCPGFIFSLKCRVADFAAKSLTTFRSVLPLQPRLHGEHPAALRAAKLVPFQLIDRGVPYLKGIGWDQAFSPSISDLVPVRHFAVSKMPFSAARETTKSSLCGSIWFHSKRRAANFTGQFNHLLFLAGTTGVAKHIEDAQRQGQLFGEAA